MLADDFALLGNEDASCMRKHLDGMRFFRGIIGGIVYVAVIDIAGAPLGLAHRPISVGKQGIARAVGIDHFERGDHRIFGGGKLVCAPVGTALAFQRGVAHPPAGRRRDGNAVVFPHEVRHIVFLILYAMAVRRPAGREHVADFFTVHPRGIYAEGGYRKNSALDRFCRMKAADKFTGRFSRFKIRFDPPSHVNFIHDRSFPVTEIYFISGIEIPLHPTITISASQP